MGLLLGTSRLGCQSAKVAGLVMEEMISRENVNSTLIDLRELDLPVLQVRPAETNDPPPDLERLSSMLKQVDGVVIVAPEYKNGYPGSLKNALDYLDPGILRYKPTGIVTVSSGGFGGVNCLAQLRLVCLALGGLPIPDPLPVSNVQDHFHGDELTNLKLREKVSRFLDELLWYSQALARQRELTGR